MEENPAQLAAPKITETDIHELYQKFEHPNMAQELDISFGFFTFFTNYKVFSYKSID